MLVMFICYIKNILVLGQSGQTFINLIYSKPTLLLLWLPSMEFILLYFSISWCSVSSSQWCKNHNVHLFDSLPYMQYLKLYMLVKQQPRWQRSNHLLVNTQSVDRWILSKTANSPPSTNSNRKFIKCPNPSQTATSTTQESGKNSQLALLLERLIDW